MPTHITNDDFNQFSSTQYSSLSAAVTAIGGSDAILVVAESESLASNVTVPSNVVLQVPKGSILTIGNGITLTINGPLSTDLHQIFDTSPGGTVVFGNLVSDLYPEWWGVTYGGDCTTALQACIAAADNKTIHLLDQVYGTTAELDINRFVSIEGHGGTIQALGAMAIVLDVTSGAASPQTTRNRIKDLIIDGNSLATDCVHFSGGASFSRCFDNCRAIDPTQDGFVFLDTIGGYFGPNMYANNCGRYGLYIQGCNASSFEGIYVQNGSNHGVYVTTGGANGQGVTLISVTSEVNSGYGIDIDTHACTIINPWIEANTSGGIRCTDTINTTIIGGRFNGGGSPSSTNRWLYLDNSTVQVAGGQISTQGVANWGIATLVNGASLGGVNANHDTTPGTYVGAYIGSTPAYNKGVAGTPGRIFHNDDSNKLEFDDGVNFHRVAAPITPYAYGAVGDGVTNDWTAVTNADTAAQALGEPLTVPSGNFTIANTGTISSEVYFHEGGLFGGVGSVITFSNSLHAGDYQIFDNVSADFHTQKDPANVRWWGALGDDATNDSSAFLKANVAAKNGGTHIYIPPGTYRLLSTTALDAPVEMAPGAMIRTNSVVTMASGILSAPPTHIFDISLDAAAVVRPLGTDLDVRWFGAKGDGTTDDRDAFSYADRVATYNNLIHSTILVPGFNDSLRYKIDSNLTIDAPIKFETRAIIKPDAGVAVTFNNSIIAGDYQIFDTNPSGSVIIGDTNVTDKGMARLNVMWYGPNRAQGADVSDEFGALANTINNSFNTNGLEVYCPKGSYMITTSGLVITADNVRWINDPGVRMNMQTGEDAYITFSGCNNCEFTGGEILSSPRQSGPDEPTTGIVLDTTTNVRIKNTKCHLLDRGIFITDQTFYSLLDNVWVHNCTWASDSTEGGNLYINKGSNDNRFINLRSAGGADSGVRIAGESTSLRTSTNVFVGCSFESGAGNAGILIEDWAYNNQFLNCRLENATNTYSTQIEANTKGNAFLNMQHAEPLNYDASGGENFSLFGFNNVTPFSATGRNYLQNAGFTYWLVGGTPENWSVTEGSSPTLTQKLDTSSLRRGSASMGVTKTTAAAVVVSQSVSAQDLEFLKGKQVAFGAWVKADISGGYTNDIALRIDDGVGTITTGALQIDNQWTWVGRTKEIDASATEVSVDLILAGTYPTGREALFSDVQLTVGNTIMDIGPKVIQDDGGTIYGALTCRNTIAASGIQVDSTGDILWATDGNGDIGTSSDNRPANIYATTLLNSGNVVSIPNMSLQQVDLSTGLGTTQNVASVSATSELLVINRSRTDGSGNISVALGWDANAATPTADHKIISVGYVDNSDAWQETVNFQAQGDLMANGRSTGQALEVKSLTEVVTIAAAATTDSTIQFPANSISMGVSVRTQTAMTTAVNYDVGVAGDATRYFTNVSDTPGTTDAIAQMDQYTSATAIRFTPDTTPGAADGSVRLTIHFIEITAPSS